MLNKDQLKGSLVYYDGKCLELKTQFVCLGAHNDARMNLAIVLSAVRHGAKAANHVKVEHLLKNEEGKLCGAHLKDMLTGKEWDVRAKSIVNATGPFTDSIRIMANSETTPICSPSGKVNIFS